MPQEIYIYRYIYISFSLYRIENPLHLIGPLASGRTNRKATTSILTTGYPGIKRSPNSYSSGNGIEKHLYLSLSNIELKVVTPQTAAEEIREESKPSGPAEATIMSDNDLLLDLGPNTSGDEDVDYAAPRTPSYCPPTDTEEHMMEDEQNDAYENSPPPSQPRPPARNTNENNPRDQKQPENRGIKLKYIC